MALQVRTGNLKKTYQRIESCDINFMRDKFSIRTKIYQDKNDEIPILEPEYILKKQGVIDLCMDEAKKYVENNIDEVNTLVEASIKQEIISHKKSNPDFIDLSDKEKRVIKDKITNRLIEKKKEEFGNSRWETIKTKAAEIRKLQYEILKLLPNFSDTKDA